MIPQLLSTPVHWTKQMAQRHKTTGMAPTSVTNCRLVLSVSLFCSQSCLLFFYYVQPMKNHCCTWRAASLEHALDLLQQQCLGYKLKFANTFPLGFYTDVIWYKFFGILTHTVALSCCFMVGGGGRGGEIWVILFLAAKAEVCMAFCCGMTLEKMDC